MSEKEGGTKYDQDKPQMALLPARAIIEVSKVLTFGATKYGAYNWKGGIKYTRIYSATMRHLFKWLMGQDKDEETGISHLAHAATNVLFLLEFVLEERNELDDRHKY